MIEKVNADVDAFGIILAEEQRSAGVTLRFKVDGINKEVQDNIQFELDDIKKIFEALKTVFPDTRKEHDRWPKD